MRFPATVALVLLLCAGFIVQMVIAIGGYMRDTHATLTESIGYALTHGTPRSFEAAAITRDAIRRGELWRLITATLLHAGFVHLAINGWVLLQLGSVFERLFGAARLLIVYAVSAMVASATSAVLLDAQFSVGASGAIFGVLGAILAMVGAAARYRSWVVSLRLQLALWAAATLILGFVSPRIDNAAHVGGFIAGLALGAVLRQAR